MTITRVFLTLLLLLSLAGCQLPFQKQTASCKSIAVGILIGDTETNPIAAEQNEGYNLAVQMINESGGIHGCPLKLERAVEVDEEGSIQTRDTVRRLVEEKNVIALLGATSNTASMQAVSILQFFKTPMLVPSAGGEHVLPAENLWGFRLQATETSYAQTVFSMVKDSLGEDGRVVVIFEDTTEGHDAAVAAVNALEAQGLKAVGYFPIRSVQSKSYEILPQALNDLRPNVAYIVFNQTDLAAHILAVLNETQPQFTIARGGGLATQSFLLKQIGQPSAETLLIATQWPATVQALEEDPFFQAYAAATTSEENPGSLPSMFTIEAYKGLQIIAAAAGRVLATGKAAPTETEKFRAALREEMRSYQENTPFWGVINFAAGGQSPSQVWLARLQGENMEIVYPPNEAE